MNQASNQWGVELSGADEDKKVWALLLKPPFDPFVEEVKDERGDFLVLRSTNFDGIVSSHEVHKLGKELFSTLNVVISTDADTDPIAYGAVVEFSQNGPPRKHQFIEGQVAAFRFRAGNAALTLTDAEGKVIEPPPAPSRTQLWMRAATLNTEIGSALRYLEGRPSWVELYKAYEAVRQMPNGGISKSEINRFTQTANVGQRHHPSVHTKPHAKPMELWEARALITKWVSAAIDDALAKDTTDLTKA